VELKRLVLSQLAENSRRAMPQGGIFNVSLQASTAAPKAEWACLTVRDTGLGMSEEVRAHLFEPFYTTQDFGKGAGLGLAMIFGIVRQHGGRIEAASEPEKGTQFRILLPLAASPG
jgi:signal transduction histidine kinase